MKKLARRDNKVRNIAGFIYAFEAFLGGCNEGLQDSSYEEGSESGFINLTSLGRLNSFYQLRHKCFFLPTLIQQPFAFISER